MKTALALLVILAVATGARAQSLKPAPIAATSTRSVSGQFLVTAPQSYNQGFAWLTVPKNVSFVRLEPSFLAISAERIKQAVWRELGVTGLWQNKATFVLHPARSADEVITIVSERVPSGWSYRIAMPDQLSEERYMRVIVQVVLLELANRSAGTHPAEIPPWLVEGLTFHLMSNNRSELVIPPPNTKGYGVLFTSVMSDIKQLSPLEKAHKALLGTTPLTFEELSWPAPGQIDGPGGASYRACAQLFTFELLHLRGGRACMRQFLIELPGYLNWQMAFLSGFRAHFSRPLDVEKWWTLEATAFAGRDLIQTWTYEDSWTKLAVTLLEPVNIFVSTNELPRHSEVKIQTIIREWPADRRADVLRGKLAELHSLRLRIAPELAALTGDYAQAVDKLLNSEKRGVRPALQQLDALDAQLDRMRPQTASAPVLVPPPR